jgi:hypothetical protein
MQTYTCALFETNARAQSLRNPQTAPVTAAHVVRFEDCQADSPDRDDPMDSLGQEDGVRGGTRVLHHNAPISLNYKEGNLMLLQPRRR